MFCFRLSLSDLEGDGTNVSVKGRECCNDKRLSNDVVDKSHDQNVVRSNDVVDKSHDQSNYVIEPPSNDFGDQTDFDMTALLDQSHLFDRSHDPASSWHDQSQRSLFDQSYNSFDEIIKHSHHLGDDIAQRSHNPSDDITQRSHDMTDDITQRSHDPSDDISGGSHDLVRRHQVLERVEGGRGGREGSEVTLRLLERRSGRETLVYLRDEW